MLYYVFRSRLIINYIELQNTHIESQTSLRKARKQKTRRKRNRFVDISQYAKRKEKTEYI